MSKIQATDLDRYLGNRVRERRLEMGMTLTKLADHLGISWQQVHKYEKGANKMSVGVLYGIALVLNADITYFFEGYGQKLAKKTRVPF